MTTRELTCVVCPAGCRMTVTLDDGGTVLEVEGNTCARGKNYAVSEITHPVRTLTSTVPLVTAEGEKMLPVRTDKAIPKEKLFEAMEIIRSSTQYISGSRSSPTGRMQSSMRSSKAAEKEGS